MAKLNKGIIAYNQTTHKKGKIIAVLPSGDYKVEVILSQDKETGVRKSVLEDWKEAVTVKYRKPSERNHVKIEHWSKSFGDGETYEKKDTLLFAKVKPEAIIPTKRLEDGCYDVYVLIDDEEVIIKPHEIKLFSTGIATAVSPKYRLDFKRERGSTGTIGLVPRSGQVDSGYRGEIFIPLQNTTNKDIIISKKTNEKIVLDSEIIYPYTKAVCQMAVEVVPDLETKEITFVELQAIPSLRGNGALGSSGK